MNMKAGDNGVLQNLKYSYWLNGLVVKVIGNLEERRVERPGGVVVTKMAYIVNTPLANWRGDNLMAAQKHQIRPITDPDAEQETAREKELVK